VSGIKRRCARFVELWEAPQRALAESRDSREALLPTKTTTGRVDSYHSMVATPTILW